MSRAPLERTEMTDETDDTLLGVICDRANRAIEVGSRLPTVDELAQALTECAPTGPGIWAEAEAIWHELRKNRSPHVDNGDGTITYPVDVAALDLVAAEFAAMVARIEAWEPTGDTDDLVPIEVVLEELDRFSVEVLGR